MQDRELEQIIRHMGGLHFAKFERHGSGTTSAVTMRVNGFIKITEDQNEGKLLARLRHILGRDYETIFPRARVIGHIPEGYILELEYLGDTTFEDMLLENTPFSNETCSAVIAFVQHTIETLALHAAPISTRQRSTKRFLDELIESLTENAKRAGVIITLASESRLREICAFIPTLCHRDLGVANILCQNDIRLIDPRNMLPGASKKRRGLYGSIACDCAMFAIGFERKQRERTKNGLDPLTEHKESFEAFVKTCIDQRLFSQMMYELCRAHVYALFAACACSYCLAPERVWLYDLMQQSLQKTLEPFIKDNMLRVASVPMLV